jgi:hypothetical protein
MGPEGHKVAYPVGLHRFQGFDAYRYVTGGLNAGISR